MASPIKSATSFDSVNDLPHQTEENPFLKWAGVLPMFETDEEHMAWFQKLRGHDDFDLKERS